MKRASGCLVVLLVLGSFAAALYADSAEAILQAAGVKGGLIVHLGCGDGRLTAALHANESYVVHGLDADAANIEKARTHIRSLGLYGPVAIEPWAGGALPYVDNGVNLLVAEDLGGVPMAEVMRVLAPLGVAYVKGKDGQWAKTVKPRPKEIDEWTHFLHGADGNAVAHDSVVGPPRHMQWLGAPAWSRYHHMLASISAVVSSGGRIFYIVDEGPAGSMQVPGKWSIEARDAFSGVLLWKRPIPAWAYWRQRFRSGPVQLPRTLVAGGDCVYLPVGIDAPIAGLDAATGQTVRTYPDTRNTEEVILDGGVLLVVVGSPAAEQAAVDPDRKATALFPNQKSIVAVRADTGERLWTWSEGDGDRLMPLTVAAGGGRVFFQAGRGVVCLDGRTGKPLWNTAAGAEGARGAKGATQGNSAQAAAAPPNKGQKKGADARGAGWSVATLVAADGVVLWAFAGRLTALAQADGQALWECPSRPGAFSPVDVFVINGLVWLGPGFSEGRDLRTGEVRKTNNVLEDLRTAGHHHRCYREKATDRYILENYRGIEFLDLVGDNHSRNNWIRGGCQYGIMPANGLVYAPPHACGCFMEAKLFGFWAVAADRKPAPSPPPAGDVRLVRGPAFGQAAPAAPPAAQGADEWPTYRHDPLRSGSTKTPVPAQLGQVWQVKVGGRLTPPVVAEGLVVLASIDEARVLALDAADGKQRWAFTVGSRVDSPPTVWRGLVLFGSADGWVYCLRAADGALAWRFRAAPEDRHTVAFDQVESVWPVHGSVLVEGGVAYVAAGRNSYLDGGIRLYGLDPATGRKVCEGLVGGVYPKGTEGTTSEPPKKFSQNAVDGKTFSAPDHSDAFSMAGTRSEVLVSDGTSIYLHQVRLDRNCVQQPQMGRHLFSTSQLLDGAENHRSHWVLGTGDFSRTPVAYSWIADKPGNYGSRLCVPYGLMLAFDDAAVWIVSHKQGEPDYVLEAGNNRPFAPNEPPLPDFRPATKENETKVNWSVPLAMRPRAMVRADKALLVGGTPLPAAGEDPYPIYDDRTGGLLWVMAADGGAKLAEYRLAAPPVWDGMAATTGRLYIALMNGQVVCFKGEGQ